jgi:cytochrome P450
MRANPTDIDRGAFSPPAPKPRPNGAHNMVWLRSAAVLPAVIRSPISAFSQNAYEQSVLHTRMFQQPMVMVHDPGLLRHLFVEKAELLIADPIRQKILKPALREGMLTAEGDVWRRARKAIAPVFAPRHVDGFASSMHKVTARYVERLRNGPTEIRLADEMTRLAYLILSETLFSGDLDDDSEGVISDVAYFLKHLSRPDPVDFMGVPDWFPRLTKLRGTGALKRLRAGVRRTAEQRRLRMDAGEDIPEDFLTMLLRSRNDESTRLTIDEIEDNIITFIAAGHETTARALAWTLYLLAFDPNALERCQAEVDALDVEVITPQAWGEQLPWLTACFEESMRLFPPAAIIARRMAGDIDYKDIQIKDGTNLVASPWVLHRHTLLWDRPNEFRPDRFHGDNRAAIDRFAYLPFGLGHRVCIGSRFAMQEALIVLSMLMRSFHFEYCGSQLPWPVMKITVQPDNGIPVKIIRRS